jgi:hypothetical protein
MTRASRVRGDEGVSLVLALVFITLVGLFATVALRTAETTTLSGVGLRDRGQLEYSLDGAVERGLQVVTSDMADADPSQCAQESSPSATGTLAVNSRTTTWTCTLLAGRAKKSSDRDQTDYAIVVTSPAANALTTQSGSDDLIVKGSVYVNGKVTNSALNKVLALVDGDYVAADSTSCDADLTALTRVSVDSDQLKSCTDQSVASAQPAVVLPTAPVVDVSGLHVTKTTGSGQSKKTCRIFYPGLYASAPDLVSDGNYFVSGLYYFRNNGTIKFDSNTLTVSGGKRVTADDTAALSDHCSALGVTDDTAMAETSVAAVLSTLSGYRYSQGVTWVLGGTTSLELAKGKVSLYTPPTGASSAPLSIVALPAASNGYLAISASGGGTPLAVHGFSNNTNAHFNAKVHAPSSRLELFSTNDTEAVARSGVVAYELQLQASNGGSGNGLAITGLPGRKNPAPPFRTVKIVGTDTSGGSTGKVTAVATVSNYPSSTGAYEVKVKSWRSS